MAAMVISEFVDEDHVNGILAGQNELYDAARVDRRAKLFTAIADARALIVRNRTEVAAALLAQAPKLEVAAAEALRSGQLAGGR